MRVVKEIEIVNCDMCGIEDPCGGCCPLTIDHKSWDICSLCFPKLMPALEFLTVGVGADISFSLEAQDDAS